MTIIVLWTYQRQSNILLKSQKNEAFLRVRTFLWECKSDISTWEAKFWLIKTKDVKNYNFEKGQK